MSELLPYIPGAYRSSSAGDGTAMVVTTHEERVVAADAVIHLHQGRGRCETNGGRLVMHMAALPSDALGASVGNVRARGRLRLRTVKLVQEGRRAL